MWAEGPSAETVRTLVEALQDPGPLPRGPRRSRPLPLEVTPEGLLAGLPARDRPGTVWLDGGEEGTHLISWDPLVRLSCADGRVGIRSAGDSVELEGGVLAAVAALEHALEPGGGRLFGFLGYELAHEIEALPPAPPAEIELPDAWLGVHDFWLVYRAGAWRLVAATGTGQERAETLLETLSRADLPSPPAPGDGLRLVAERTEPGAEEYRAAVERTVERIHAGEIFQTNLCRRFAARLAKGDPWELYRALRRQGDASHGAWIVTDAAAVLSRSPETYLRLRDRDIESHPIKGTRPRGHTPEADEALRAELAASDKEGAELAMIVDLIRNDLGRVCVPGSVEVEEHRTMVRLPRVWHTLSRVRGRLREDVGVEAILRATFPPGSITGAPKIQAMIVAAGEESCRRGVAMGAIGWIDPGGDLELSVAIRTAAATAARVVYHAGCGIVADSRADAELEESRVKAGPFLGVVAG